MADKIPPVTADELLAGKAAVIKQGLGICSLPERELLAALDVLYWTGFKAGCEHMERSEKAHG